MITRGKTLQECWLKTLQEHYIIEEGIGSFFKNAYNSFNDAYQDAYNGDVEGTYAKKRQEQEKLNQINKAREKNQYTGEFSNGKTKAYNFLNGLVNFKAGRDWGANAITQTNHYDRITNAKNQIQSTINDLISHIIAADSVAEVMSGDTYMYRIKEKKNPKNPDESIFYYYFYNEYANRYPLDNIQVFKKYFDDNYKKLVQNTLGVLENSNPLIFYKDGTKLFTQQNSKLNGRLDWLKDAYSNAIMNFSVNSNITSTFFRNIGTTLNEYDNQINTILYQNNINEKNDLLNNPQIQDLMYRKIQFIKTTYDSIRKLALTGRWHCPLGREGMDTIPMFIDLNSLAEYYGKLEIYITNSTMKDFVEHPLIKNDDSQTNNDTENNNDDDQYYYNIEDTEDNNDIFFFDDEDNQDTYYGNENNYDDAQDANAGDEEEELLFFPNAENLERNEYEESPSINVDDYICEAKLYDDYDNKKEGFPIKYMITTNEVLKISENGHFKDKTQLSQFLSRGKLQLLKPHNACVLRYSDVDGSFDFYYYFIPEDGVIKEYIVDNRFKIVSKREKVVEAMKSNKRFKKKFAVVGENGKKYYIGLDNKNDILRMTTND